MTLLMETLKLFGSFVQLNLGSLSFGYFLFKLLAFVSYLNSKFLDLKSEFLDLSLVSTTILLKSQVILLFLASGKCPLL